MITVASPILHFFVSKFWTLKSIDLGLGWILASQIELKIWKKLSKIEASNFLFCFVISDRFFINFVPVDPWFLLAWPVFCKVFRFFTFSEMELIFSQNILKKHLKNEVQIIKQLLWKTCFFWHWFLLFISSILEPKMSPNVTESREGIWLILANFSLWWLQSVFLHIQKVFETIFEAFGTILEGFGEHCWEDFEESYWNLDVFLRCLGFLYIVSLPHALALLYTQCHSFPFHHLRRCSNNEGSNKQSYVFHTRTHSRTHTHTHTPKQTDILKHTHTHTHTHTHIEGIRISFGKYFSRIFYSISPLRHSCHSPHF